MTSHIDELLNSKKTAAQITAELIKESGAQQPPNVDDAKIAEQIVGGDPDVPEGGNHGDIDAAAMIGQLRALAANDLVSPTLKAEAGMAATKLALKAAHSPVQKDLALVQALADTKGSSIGTEVGNMANLVISDQDRATAANPATLAGARATAAGGSSGQSGIPAVSVTGGAVGGVSGDDSLIPRTTSGTTSGTYVNISAGLGANLKLTKSGWEAIDISKQIDALKARSKPGHVSKEESDLREQLTMARLRISHGG
jgi:hypothetical protein